MMELEIEVESSKSNNDSDVEMMEEGGCCSGNIFNPSQLVPPCTTADNSSRFVISKIIIENFKSYQGIHEIAIHSNCTALVGPNDSGKSSAVDAILFAIGQRDSKLQINNLSCLIHSSSRYKKVNSSSVTLIFQQLCDEGIGNEIIVKRTVLKDNSSFYELNEKSSTLMEIAKLFSDYGIDIASNRFLILHDENDQMDDEHDQEILEYLEDIIGTTTYKLRIACLTDRIDDMEENLIGKMEFIQSLNTDLAAMETPSNTAAEYLNENHERQEETTQAGGLPDYRESQIYRSKVAEFSTCAEEMEVLCEQRIKHENMRNELNEDRYKKFMKIFKEISGKLLEIYGMLSDGGEAMLDLVNPFKPFAEGVVFKVKPLEKSWKVISDLSVGEKALASLSLFFAVHSSRSSRLYVMDDIDAHLDANHIARVRKYIRSTNNAQFIIASRESYKFSLCDRVISLYNDQECTRSTILNNNSK